MRKRVSAVILILVLLGVLLGMWLVSGNVHAPELAAKSGQDSGSPLDMDPRGGPGLDPDSPTAGNAIEDGRTANGPLEGTGEPGNVESRLPPGDPRPETETTTEGSGTGKTGEGSPADPDTETLVVEGNLLEAESSAPVKNTAVLLRLPDIVLSAVSDDEGRFRFDLPELKELPEGARLVVDSHRHMLLDVEAKPGSNTLMLTRVEMTTVIVRVTGVTVFPDEAWLRDEGDPGAEQAGSSFSAATGTATIRLHSRTIKGLCRACAVWFDRVIESEPFEINWGAEQTVTLSPPPGARVTVRVIGPDGVGMEGVTVCIGDKFESPLRATTDKLGNVTFSEVPVPLNTFACPEFNADGVFCVQPQQISLAAADETLDLVFDLGGTGIVDCQMTLGGSRLSSFLVSAADDAWPDDHKVSQHRPIGSWDILPRVYGLKPGRYRVKSGRAKAGQVFKADVEVLAPPEISRWRPRFASTSLTVRVAGGGASGRMELMYWATNTLDFERGRDAGDGSFLIENLGTSTLEFRVYGGGYASAVTSVNPAETTEIEIVVVESGRVGLTAKANMEILLWLSGIEPVAARFPSGYFSDSIELAPGRYSVAPALIQNAPWGPIEFVVEAGKVTECEYGPEYSAIACVRVRDRTPLPHESVKVYRAGQEVPSIVAQFFRSGDEGHNVYFTAEGQLKLTINMAGYEPVEKEFTASRDAPVNIEVELKRKQ